MSLMEAIDAFNEISRTEKEYVRILDRNAENLDTAAMHVLQQIGAVDDRRLRFASARLENMQTASATGAEARLLSFMEGCMQSTESTVLLMQQRLEQSKEEVKRFRDASAFVSEALQSDYEKMRSAYSKLSKEVDLRTESNDRRWVRFLAESQTWEAERVNEIQGRYMRNDDEYSKKRAEGYMKINDKLQRSLDKAFASVEKSLQDSAVDLKVQFHHHVNEDALSKNQYRADLHSWLNSTLSNIDQAYSEQLEKYQALLIDLRHHIYNLENYSWKLDQLAKTYRQVGSDSLEFQVKKLAYYHSVAMPTDGEASNASVRSRAGFDHRLFSYNADKRYPLSKVMQAADTDVDGYLVPALGSAVYNARPRYPPHSLAIGSRIFELARAVGYSPEALTNHLIELFYEVPYNDLVSEQLMYVCSAYTGVPKV
jgi:uncharacterized membrane-anchored protein YhcB (DUF1043 family)